MCTQTEMMNVPIAEAKEEAGRDITGKEMRGGQWQATDMMVVKLEEVVSSM